MHSRTTDQSDSDGFFVRFAPTSGGIFLDCTVQRGMCERGAGDVVGLTIWCESTPPSPSLCNTAVSEQFNRGMLQCTGMRAAVLRRLPPPSNDSRERLE